MKSTLLTFEVPGHSVQLSRSINGGEPPNHYSICSCGWRGSIVHNYNGGGQFSFWGGLVHYNGDEIHAYGQLLDHTGATKGYVMAAIDEQAAQMRTRGVDALHEMDKEKLDDSYWRLTVLHQTRNVVQGLNIKNGKWSAATDWQAHAPEGFVYSLYF